MIMMYNANVNSFANFTLVSIKTHNAQDQDSMQILSQNLVEQKRDRDNTFILIAQKNAQQEYRLG